MFNTGASARATTSIREVAQDLFFSHPGRQIGSHVVDREPKASVMRGFKPAIRHFLVEAQPGGLGGRRRPRACPTAAFS
jgi:hypothetical protein